MTFLQWLSENPRFALVVPALLYIIFALPFLEEGGKRRAAQKRAERWAHLQHWQD